MRSRWTGSPGASACATDAQAGFTLLEVMVAFVILAVFLGVLYQGVSVSMASAGRSRDYVAAELLARSQLDALAATAADGDRPLSGQFGERYRWRADIRREMAGASEVADLYRIRVAVGWAGAPSAVTLETLRVIPRHAR